MSGIIKQSHYSRFPFTTMIDGLTETFTVQEVEQDPIRYIDVLPPTFFEQGQYERISKLKQTAKSKEVEKRRARREVTANDSLAEVPDIGKKLAQKWKTRQKKSLAAFKDSTKASEEAAKAQKLPEGDKKTSASKK